MAGIIALSCQANFTNMLTILALLQFNQATPVQVSQPTGFNQEIAADFEPAEGDDGPEETRGTTR